ncbi:MAG: DUF4369 domain-containing protein [Prevotella sp.]|nr:DUF4369 domain-containing protein [Prevotella sp.]
MKRILFFSMVAIAAIVTVGCKKSEVCRIHGTIVGEQYEGKRIFLVPFTGPATAETVDSMEIKDGKFEFAPDSMQMYKILLDYHYRFATQPLIVIAEPGDIQVTIDTISSAVGTPQNDSLQTWKELTESHGSQARALNLLIAAKKQHNDTIEAAQLKEQMKTMRIAYNRRSRELAAHMEGTILGDFLKGMFPETYQRQLPDGTVVTMNFDTNEPVQ